MDPVSLFLLSVAGIFVIGAVGEIIFQKTNIPDVIWLILSGLILGPIGGIVKRADLESIAPYFAAVTLVVVLFEGGSALKLRELSRTAPRSSVLGVLAFVASVAGVAILSMLAGFAGWLEHWSWTHGLLLGAIVGGSSSIIIMPAMAQARLQPKLANLVNLESALTDALCVVSTVALIDVMRPGGGGADPAVALLKSFGIGLAIGTVAGMFWILFLRFLHSHEHAYPITLSSLLVLYVVIDRLGGSAALGILTVAVILGNAPAISVKIGMKEPTGLDTSVRGFHRQMAFIIKSFFFVFIGAMLTPSWYVLLGVVLAGVLVTARVPAVFLATAGSGLTTEQKTMAVISLPRGMAAGVLATLPMAAHIPGTGDLPVIVFSCVLTTIVLFAVGFPLVKRRLPPPTEEETTEPASRVPLPAGAAVPRGFTPGAPAPEARLPDAAPAAVVGQPPDITGRPPQAAGQGEAPAENPGAMPAAPSPGSPRGGTPSQTDG